MILAIMVLLLISCLLVWLVVLELLELVFGLPLIFTCLSDSFETNRNGVTGDLNLCDF